MKLLLLALVFGLAYAQNAKPCVSPSKWESHVDSFDRDRHYSVRSRFAYDADTMSTRAIDEVSYHQERRFFDILRLYQTKTEYVLDLHTRKCEKHALDHDFIKIGVEDGAESHGEVYIGGETAGTGLLVSLWEGKTTSGDYYWGSFSYTGCIPIHHGFYSNRTGEISRRFYDVTAGIRDNTIFSVPKECM